jgi:hypothetical protein
VNIAQTPFALETGSVDNYVSIIVDNATPLSSGDATSGNFLNAIKGGSVAMDSNIYSFDLSASNNLRVFEFGGAEHHNVVSFNAVMTDILGNSKDFFLHLEDLAISTSSITSLSFLQEGITVNHADGLMRLDGASLIFGGVGDFNVTDVPEPASILLLLGGLMVAVRARSLNV